MKLKILFCLFFSLLGSIEVHGISENVKIQITAKQFRNQAFRITSYGIEEEIQLDAKGSGNITLELKHETFVWFYFNDIEVFSDKYIFLKNGQNLFITIDDDNCTFKGEGGPVNTLIECCAKQIDLYSKLYKEQVEEGKSINELATFLKNIDQEFDSFYESQKQKYSINEKDDYLVRNNFIAALLRTKQSFLSNQTYEEVDSLNLVDFLGISSTDLFGDTLLLNANCDNFWNFLVENFNFQLANDPGFKDLELNEKVFFIENKILSSKIYSTSAKENILYYNVSLFISSIGKKDEMDSHIANFKKNFPFSIYTEKIVKQYDEFNHLAKGQQAPDFTFKSLEGDSVSISDYKGQLIFIDIWATWCSPCIEGIPIVSQLEKQFTEVRFMFISNDSDEEKWKTFVNNSELKQSLNLKGRNIDFMGKYKVTGIPRYILIDKEGKIIDAFLSHDKSDIEEILTKYTE